MNLVTLMNATKIFNQFGQVQISPRLAYKIMKFCKGVASEEEFYNTRRNEIINKYALKDDDGNIMVSDDGMIRIIDGKIDEANDALKELSNVEVDVPKIKFTLAELDELKLSVADMFVLDSFIEE